MWNHFPRRRPPAASCGGALRRRNTQTSKIEPAAHASSSSFWHPRRPATFLSAIVRRDIIQFGLARRPKDVRLVQPTGISKRCSGQRDANGTLALPVR